MKKLLYTALVLAPSLAFAQGAPTLGNINVLLGSISRLVDMALPVVLGLALLGFFWGLAKFIFSQGDEEAKMDGKKIMIWGISALFVMVAVWGLVGFIADALGVQTGGSAQVPGVSGL